MTCPISDKCWRDLTGKDEDRPKPCQFEVIDTMNYCRKWKEATGYVTEFPTQETPPKRETAEAVGTSQMEMEM